MTKGTRRVLMSLVLVLAAVVALLPGLGGAALALDADQTFSIGGTKYDCTQNHSGTGWEYVAGTCTLTLSGYSFDGYAPLEGHDPTVIFYGPRTGTFTIVLEGNNTITQHGLAERASWGIYSRTDFTIKGDGTLTVSTADGSIRGAAIYAEKNLEISGGTIVATSGTVTGNLQGYGIGGGNTSELTIGEGAKLTLAGPKGATNTIVKSAVPCMGWKDTAGTEGRTGIAANTQSLIDYLRVEFPAKTAKVTFKVANGSWDDATAEDKLVTLYAREGESLSLADSDIPTVGTKPADGYQVGAWDVTPSTDAVITADTTYTYTYEKKPVLVSSVKLDRTELSLAPGGKAQLTATVEPADATHPDLDWESSDKSVATVDGAGIVTAVAPGTATITAKATDGSGKSAACVVTVTEPDVPVSSVKLDKAKLSLAPGGRSQLKVTIEPANATHPDIDWDSSDLSVATVDGAGIVTAVAPGTATITARATDGSGKSAACVVTVTKPVPVSSVTLEKTELSLEPGGKAQMKVTVSPADATHPDLDWESSDQSVATVDGAGIVTAVAPGTATITARATDGSGKSAACVVTVAAAPTPAATYACTKGSGSTWEKGSKSGLALTFKRTAEGETADTTFAHFKSVSVDGKELAKGTDYDAAEGSVVVTLRPAYLETLAEGGHELVATFDDGSAKAEFAVAKKASGTAKATTTARSSLPRTSDPSAPAAALALAVPGAALAASGLRRRRGQR